MSFGIGSSQAALPGQAGMSSMLSDNSDDTVDYQEAQSLVGELSTDFGKYEDELINAVIGLSTEKAKDFIDNIFSTIDAADGVKDDKIDVGSAEDALDFAKIAEQDFADIITGKSDITLEDALANPDKYIQTNENDNIDNISEANKIIDNLNINLGAYKDEIANSVVGLTEDEAKEFLKKIFSILDKADGIEDGKIGDIAKILEEKGITQSDFSGLLNDKSGNLLSQAILEEETTAKEPNDAESTEDSEIGSSIIDKNRTYV